MNFEYPDFFAKHYDLIYHQIRDEVDHTYFLNKIKSVQGKVLEVGVGTGRFFKDALNAGTDIYGIDVSPEMLNILKDKLEVQHYKRVSQQSIIDFKFQDKFNLILAPFRVIMHVLDKNDQLTAINNVYNHLGDGGEFIFDTFIPELNALINGLNNVTDFEGDYEPGKKLRRIVSTKPDLINQTIQIQFKFEWETNRGLEKYEWKLPLRFFFRYELEHLIERSKFKQYKILGDYKGSPLNSGSKEFIMICKK